VALDDPGRHQATPCPVRTVIDFALGPGYLRGSGRGESSHRPAIYPRSPGQENRRKRAIGSLGATRWPVDCLANLISLT
jgi:hypothetical protein